MVEPAQILVVDDEVGIREVCRINLELAGYAVHEAADGDGALAALSEIDVDLLVLDARMPGTDGWGVLRSMVETGSQIPVVMLTASSGSGEIERAEALGARFLSKPFHPAELCDVVASLLEPDARRTGPA